MYAVVTLTLTEGFLRRVNSDFSGLEFHFVAGQNLISLSLSYNFYLLALLRGVDTNLCGIIHSYEQHVRGSLNREKNQKVKKLIVIQIALLSALFSLSFITIIQDRQKLLLLSSRELKFEKDLHEILLKPSRWGRQTWRKFKLNFV